MNKPNILFMALAKGKASVEAAEIKRYVGIAPVNIVAVNPNSATIKELMGYEPKEEPVYVGTQEIDGKNVPYARITFVIKTIVTDEQPIDTTQMLTFFVRNQYRRGSQSGKYQVIDEYGRTAWADENTIKVKGEIMYSNGPANVTTNYRPCYVGEEELTDFISAYLNIPNPANYINGTWVMKSQQELLDCQCRLDTIPEFFKGNFKEITDAITLMPNNKIKVLFGIRSNDNGQEYQDVYSHMVLRYSSTNVSRLQKDVEDRKANGGLSNRYYEFTPIHEYKVVPTNLNETPVSDDPFATENSPWLNS